jgi:hypothetical protein
MAQQPCRSCDCFDKCANKGGAQPYYKFIKTNAPATADESPNLARFLNLAPTPEPKKKGKLTDKSSDEAYTKLVEEEESTGAEGEIIQVICWMPPSQKLIF